MLIFINYEMYINLQFSVNHQLSVIVSFVLRQFCMLIIFQLFIIFIHSNHVQKHN
jgi:hypothetical protein